MASYSHSSDIDEIASRIGAAAHGLAGKTVLITGGLGFLGRYFIETFHKLNERMLEEPVRVVAVDNGCRGRECTLLLDETGNLNEPR